MGWMHSYGSLGVHQNPKCRDALIDLFNFIRLMYKKLQVCTYSPVQFTFRFVNLFVEVSRVWAMAIGHSPIRILLQHTTVAKGQTILKANYGLLKSPKKLTKRTQDSILSAFLSFFGRIEETIICFRDILTFTMYVHTT